MSGVVGSALGGHVQRVLGTCQEVPGQGPSTERTGTLSSRVARALYLDSHVDRQIE